MGRKLKNIIMILLIIIVALSSYFTMNYANNNTEKNISQNNMGNMQNNGGQPPEMPNGDSGNMQEPPEKPDGENSSNSSNTNEQKEMPNGNNGEMMEPQNGMGMAPTKNDESSNSIALIYYILFGIESLIISMLIMYLLMSKFNKKSFKETFKSSEKIIIYILSVIIITFALVFIEISNIKSINSNNNGSSINQNGFGGESSQITYSAVKEITESAEITSGKYKSTEADENTILVSGDIDTTIENVTISKTGDSDGGDNTSFYGINSAILAKSGANLTLKNLTITTDATGANGVFSYGGSATTNNTSSDGTTINISDSSITTTKDNSGGIMTTGGGVTNASNLTINTSGTSSAAIRSDRGGGTINVDKGTYTTTGSGSPSIYSTAKIIVNDATLVSKVSEGIVIEGANSVEINDCDVTDSNTKLNGLSTTYKNIFLYQSMSGDASTGNAVFTANNSKITTNNGDSFYITNTTATISLTNNTIINNDEEGNFLRAKSDSWGNSGSNGGDVTLVLTNQNVTGNIVIDSVSKLNMTMKTNSYYEGKINSDNTAKSIDLTLDKTSKIKLTGDSYITSLDNALSDNSNIDFNGYKLYVNGKAIN